MAVDARRRWRAAGVVVVLAVMGWAVPLTSAAQQLGPRPPQPRWCLPFDVLQHAYDGDFDRALAHSEECVASHRRWTDLRGNFVIDTRDPNGTERAYGGFWMLVFMCTSAQLQAMAGLIPQAEATLARAEDWERTFQGFTSFLVEQEWRRELMAATRGFVLERAGRLQESLGAYQSAGKIGAERLAVLALAAKDDASAAKWAALAGDTPTALAVRGALAELRRDDGGAFLQYYRSDRAMRRLVEERPTNALLPPEARPAVPPRSDFPTSFADFQPLQLAERTRVIRAMGRFGTAKAPPVPLASPDVLAEQAAFNRWLQAQRTLTIPGLAFRPQYPRFFADFSRDDREAIRRRRIATPPGYDASVVVYLPDTIAVTGIIDRDTLAIDFYRLAADVLSLAARSSVSAAELLSTTQPQGASPERQVLLADLRAALAELETVYRAVQNVQLRTSAGALHTGSDEARLVSQWSPDFSTAHIEVLTPEFVETLTAATVRASARLDSARRFVP